jgi:hypothetical protein
MDAVPAEPPTSLPARARAVVLMREAWVKRVAAFIASSGTAEEARLDGRPEIVFSKIDQTGLPIHYSDFNVRSRHFRCLESFFVEVDATGRITGLVTVDGLRSDKRILNVNLLLAEPGPEPMTARLQRMLQGTVAAIQAFVPILKLRLLYIFDHSFSAPLGAHVAPVLIDEFDQAGLFEEARIANETGPGREAVLLGFLAPQEAGASA